MRSGVVPLWSFISIGKQSAPAGVQPGTASMETGTTKNAFPPYGAISQEGKSTI
jgi:hypothetical protein